jgi:hypothetical protein
MDSIITRYWSSPLNRPWNLGYVGGSLKAWEKLSIPEVLTAVARQRTSKKVKDCYKPLKHLGLFDILKY